eukprot:scaffold323_cov414-Prasinococcus_capsulatus_cf.AAC.34
MADRSHGGALGHYRDPASERMQTVLGRLRPWRCGASEAVTDPYLPSSCRLGDGSVASRVPARLPAQPASLVLQGLSRKLPSLPYAPPTR